MEISPTSVKVSSVMINVISASHQKPLRGDRARVFGVIAWFRQLCEEPRCYVDASRLSCSGENSACTQGPHLQNDPAAKSKARTRTMRKHVTTT